MNRKIVIELEEVNGEFKAKITPESDEELLDVEIAAAINALMEERYVITDRGEF